MSIPRRFGLLFAVSGVFWAWIGGVSSPNVFEDEAPTPYPTQPAQIFVDGHGSDWDSLHVRHMDVGDGGPTGIEQLSMAHNETHLFLRLALRSPVNLQEENELILAIDADHDGSTGQDTLGLGAELTWTFGDRSGHFAGEDVTHAEIGLTSLPTVRSTTFEVAINRAATPEDSLALFPGDTLRVALANESDRLPDGTATLGYVFTDGPKSADGPLLSRPDPSAVRLVSYNAVNNFDRELNSLFIDDRQPAYRRILGAIEPDVLGFQEVYDQTAEETERTVEGELGIPEGWNWAKAGQDLVLGSRFSIRDTTTIPGYRENRSAAFLLDTGSALGDSMVVVVAHPPCCNTPAENGELSSDAQRQRVVDGIAAFLRRVRTGTGPFGVDRGTPIAVLGDMNFVGDPQQPLTLQHGEIVHHSVFGASMPPDWDGTPLLDTRPRQTHSPVHTTWVDAESSFPPGRLDYVYLTDSVLDVAHEFVLYTPTLPTSILNKHGLNEHDTDRASDHLPVVVDVRPRSDTNAE